MKASLGVTGYPAVELMTLAETGTRALAGAVFGPPATGETGYARQLLHLLDETMLEAAPPLTSAQRDKLALILRGRRR